MRSLLVLAVLLAIAYSANIRSRLHYEYAFEEFRRLNGKTYATSEEYVYRLQVFADNMDKIEIHNAAPATWTMGINQFSDLTETEFQQSKFCGGLAMNKKLGSRKLKQSNGVTAEEVDWTTKGAVSDVKDQAQCGSCWAFSATGSLESAYFLKNKEMVLFSEQQLVDCSGEYGNMGCNGGLMTSAFDYIVDHGLCSSADYPYHAKDEKCKTTCKTAVSIKSYVELQPTEAALAEGTTAQPISVALNASPIQSYKKGIFSGACSDALNHGVLMVGYGEENGVKYWKVKNSWGARWGEQGYFRLKKDVTQKGGLCGIAEMTCYPEL